MARTYIPTQVVQIHKQTKYMTRYQAILRAAIVAIDPEFGAAFDTLLAAMIAFDALSQELYPLED